MYMEKEQWQLLWLWRIYRWSLIGSFCVFLASVTTVCFYLFFHDLVRVSIQDGSPQACFASVK